MSTHVGEQQHEQAQPHEPAGTEPVLEALAARKEYDGGDVVALKGADLAVYPGEFVCVMGPSGSGKSTLLHLLGTLDRPSSGMVRIKGRDVAQVKRLHVLRAQELGFVFQLHNLVPSLSLLDNVMLPMVPLALPASEKRARAKQALELVGLGHRTSHPPGKVSGGERQRAAFARALVNEPAIVLGDEPTGSVDSATGKHLLEILLQSKRQHATTLVIVTHNPELATLADRVIVIHDGELREFPRERIPRTLAPLNPFLEPLDADASL